MTTFRNIRASIIKVDAVAALLTALALFGPALVPAAEPKPAWQVEWDKAVKAAESEGEVNVYVVDYPRFAVGPFQKAFPKINLNMIDGPSGPALSSRLMAERRAGKHQADLYIAGQGTHVSVLYPAKALAPMPPVFILHGSQRRVDVVGFRRMRMIEQEPCHKLNPDFRSAR